MTQPTPKSAGAINLLGELCALRRRALGEKTETAVAIQIQALVSEMTGIRVAMEQHTQALEQAALALKEAKLLELKQEIIWEDMIEISQNISWIKAKLSQNPFD